MKQLKLRYVGKNLHALIRAKEPFTVINGETGELLCTILFDHKTSAGQASVSQKELITTEKTQLAPGAHVEAKKCVKCKNQAICSVVVWEDGEELKVELCKLHGQPFEKNKIYKYTLNE